MNTINIKALSEQVSKLSSSGGSGLPDVTAADNGKVLGVVEGSWNKMDAPTGGVDFSTNEQDTGLKWIDGRPIYQKTYVLDTKPSIGTGWHSILTKGESELTIDKIINGFVITDTGIYFPVGVACNDDTNIEVYNMSSITITGVEYFTIQYLKTTPTPATKATKKKTTK